VLYIAYSTVVDDRFSLVSQVSDADMLRSHITGQPFLHTWNCTSIASMQVNLNPLP
jgi:hypothetical protein